MFDEPLCIIIAPTSATLGATQVHPLVRALVQPNMHIFVHRYGDP